MKEALKKRKRMRKIKNFCEILIYIIIIKLILTSSIIEIIWSFRKLFTYWNIKNKIFFFLNSRLIYFTCFAYYFRCLKIYCILIID